MIIDVFPGDTFGVNDASDVSQFRGTQRRWLGHPNWNESRAEFRSISLEDFSTIARICGHTIEIQKPEPEVPVVPRPTHGAELLDRPGQHSYVGTLEGMSRRVSDSPTTYRLVKFAD